MKKIAIFLLLISICGLAYADSDIQDLDTIVTPGQSDVLHIIDDPSGTPVSKKIAISKLLGVATDLDDEGVISADSVALTTQTTGNYVGSVATTGPITGGAAGSEGATLTIAITQADTDNSGYLSDTDWDTFNNKQATVSGGDAITLDGATIDFDGGATPGGDLGNTWASPTIDDSLSVTSWNLTTPILSGITAVDDAGTIELDTVPASDETQCGIISSQTMGTTVAHGDVLYLAVADSRWELADASASASSYGLAMALGAGTDGNPTYVMHMGVVRQDTDWNWTIGDPIYLTITGTTTNTLSQTAPLASGEQVVVVGYALTADSMFFNPSMVLVEIS